MKPSYLGWLKRTWPLALSVLAAWGVVHLLPQMYSDFEFSGHGIPVAAWYTDLNQDDDVFRYAYVVGEVTYAGKASWNDADSDISSHKPGDKFKGVQYLSTKPWRSICRRDPERELREARTWVVCNLCIFFFGIGCISFVVGNASPEKSEPFSMAYWQASPQSQSLQSHRFSLVLALTTASFPGS